MVKTRCDARFHRAADETYTFATHTSHVPRSSEQLILSLTTTARRRRDSMKNWLAATCKDQYHLQRVPTAASYPRDSRQVRTPTLTSLGFIFYIVSQDWNICSHDLTTTGVEPSTTHLASHTPSEQAHQSTVPYYIYFRSLWSIRPVSPARRVRPQQTPILDFSDLLP